MRYGTIISCVALLLACSGDGPMIRQFSEVFGRLDDGRQVRLFTLTNAADIRVQIMDLGATIVRLNVPDRFGAMGDITLGFDNPQQYLDESPYFGAIVGRYANRIARGRFSLDGADYTLAVNNGPNALHGGMVGFDKRLWQASLMSNETSSSITFALASEDGDEGYPGTLEVAVTYMLDDENRLTVDYHATTDRATVINLSQHAYFNLNGHDSGANTSHELMLNADYYTPVDATLIPTGEISPVAATPMDFRVAKPIGRDIDAAFEQLQFGGGFDHNWVLNKSGTTDEPRLAAAVYAPDSGRTLHIYTDQPGLQFYAGNFLDGSLVGKQGAIYQRRQGFCLETQHYPDSPNQPTFPSTVLRLGETYKTTTVFAFGIRKKK